MRTPTPRAAFEHLTPELAIGLVEEALKTRLTSQFRPLNSYINRVFELEREAGGAVIAKFYRPGRWSRDALQEEHDFAHELAAAEIPVIAPLRDAGGCSLFQAGPMFFALFEKKGGRACDEPDDEQWRMLGRLLARVHLVGAAQSARHRIVMAPDQATRDHLQTILASGLVPQEHAAAYEDAVLDLIETISPHFDPDHYIRIHGDCHRQNIIHRPGEGFFIIDFDDMAMGPPVQDLWMLLPGRRRDAARELALLLEGYELFRTFDDTQLDLIEPLRAMRFIHYTAWCVRQAADGGFTRLVPDWGSPGWWRQEIGELRRQLLEITPDTPAADLYD